MNARSLLSFCAISASCLLVTSNQLSHAQTATKPANDPPATVATTNYPDWAYPKGVHEAQKPDDGELFHIPGSKQSYTDLRSIGAPARSIGFRIYTLCLLLR